MLNIDTVQTSSIDTNKAKEILLEYQSKVCEQTDRLFTIWIFFQWLLALLTIPYFFSFTGMDVFTYQHLVLSGCIAGFFSLVALFCCLKFPGRPFTRHTIILAQAMFCILVIYFVTKNPIIYFQLFLSLAILSYYQDIKVFFTLYTILVAHHFAFSFAKDGNSMGILNDTLLLAEYGGWIILTTVFFLLRAYQSGSSTKLLVNERMKLEKIHEEVRSQADKRAQELQNSQEALQKSNWFKTGLAELNDKMRGEQEIPIMAKNILGYLTPYLESSIAALYIKDRDNIFKIVGTYAGKSQFTEKFKWGEGLAGQAAQDKKRIIVDHVGDKLQIDVGLGIANLENIMFLPLLHENDVKGVLVLGSIKKFTEQQTEFLNEASGNIAIYFNTALSRLEMRKLLEKTEQQRRELQKQNSEIIKQQSILDEKNKQLEESNKHKSVFLANMSHELRTPLNAIIGYSELLIEDAEDMGQEDFAEDLNKIKFSGKHLLSLINGILDLSKIEAGKMDLHIEKFNIKEMLSEILVTAEPLANKNQNKLDVTYGEGLGDMNADLVKIRQILLNLLSNAAKFTERGTITVKTILNNKKDAVIFNIIDTGIGLNPQQTDRLFEPFSQADSSTTRKYGGTGLGLTISKKFCEMMGGNISVDSQEGRGSNFTVTIPLQVKKDDLEKKEQEIKKSVAKALSAKINFSSDDTPATILVIDDDLAIHDLMQRFADKEGYHLEIAMNGKEGIELAKKVKPQVIFLDVMMPNIDGWEVLKTLKSDDDMNQIPVIMISMLDDKSMGFELGASEYITKPLDLDHLSKILHKYKENDQSLSVLVVEDDHNMQDMIMRMLQKEGHRIKMASNGQIAIDSLHEQIPDIILLDLLMPQMDGFEFLVRLRTDDKWKDIPVIVVSAKQIDEKDREKLSGNVQKIIEKGAFTSDDLLDKINTLIKDSKNHK